MKAAVFNSFRRTAPPVLTVEDVPRPKLIARIRPPPRTRLRSLPHRPAHHRGRPPAHPPPSHPRPSDRRRGRRRRLPEHYQHGARVGVSWVGGTDGICPYCLRGEENLCDNPTFTGYTVDGGYAEYVLVRADFTFPLPAALDDTHVAPLLCAGIIGFRSLRVAGVKPRERVGLFGFGSSASLTIAVLRHWGCEVYVSTRGEAHRAAATALGATWVGTDQQSPPVELDRAITFAPSGAVVVSALSSLRKGGVVAINAIHLDQMPAFDYDKLLWGERQIRSVANMTRADARDFLKLAGEIGLKPRIKTFPLAQANEAVHAVKQETADGAVVIVP